MKDNIGRNILLEAFKNEIEYLYPSEIAEKYRVLSAGKYRGAYRFKRSPYMREIVDTLCPENQYRVIGECMSSQVGKTISGIANQMLAVMKQYQGDVLFMSNDDEQVKRAMKGFITDMIRESGLEGNIGAIKTKGKTRSLSGDTIREKKFGNGYTLNTWPGTTIGKLSSISPKYSFNDECERYVVSDKKAGSPYLLIMNRHKTFGGEYKAYFVTTPERKETSVIWPIYKQGDRKRYHIPCPHCGEKIILEWSIQLEGKDLAGIYYKRTSTGSVDPKSVGYVCQKCGNFFKENHKYAMYSDTEYQIEQAGGVMWVDGNKYLDKNGNGLLCEWIPTATPLEPDYGSYHISALYSGAGFHTWRAIVKEWLLANPISGVNNLDILRTFYNQELGLPWEERGRSIKSSNLMNNCRNYDIGVIPDQLSDEDGNGKIVMLTCAIDLNGKLGENAEEDDVRLDYEVVAWCEKGDEDYVTSYSIDHGSIGNFERESERRVREEKGGDREEKYTYRHGHKNNVWDIFEKEVLLKQYTTQSGKQMQIVMCGVDSGNYTIYANEFVNKHPNCVSLKGDRELDYTNIKSDKAYYKQGKSDGLYLVENNRIKDRLADTIEIKWDHRANVEQGDGFMNYPTPAEGKYGYDTYFVEYEGEHREVKKDALGAITGMRWKKKSATARQHFFDCRVYNYAIMRIVSNLYCKSYKVAISWKNYCDIVKLKTNR